MGYRNPHTQRSPESDTIDCFVGECLTLSFPRRRVAEIKGNTVLVTSRDRRLLDILPRSLGAYAYTTHYSDTCDVPTNMARAASLLQTYRTQARLIITTSLHCALAAIGMGIPVVVFDPEGAAHQSDRAHLRALDGLVVVYSFGEVDRVDWQPRPVDTAAQKLAIVDHFFALTASWRIPTMPIGPFAPASELPVPIA